MLLSVETRVSAYHCHFWAVSGKMIRIAPTFAEWTSLTEVQAFILEALRWRPVNPFGPYMLSWMLEHPKLSMVPIITGAPRRASKDVFWVHPPFVTMMLCTQIKLLEWLLHPCGSNRVREPLVSRNDKLISLCDRLTDVRPSQVHRARPRRIPRPRNVQP